MDTKDKLLKFLSRKFFVAVLALLLVVFAIDVPAEEKLRFVTWIVGIYVVGQALQNSVEASKS